MRANTSRDSRGSLEGLMHAPEVVPHVENGHLVHVVVDLLAKSVREPREPAHAHSHVQVLSFDVTRRTVGAVGIATDSDSFGAKTLRRTVALLSLRSVAVDLHELREVDIVPKRFRNGIQVHLMAVRGQLNSIRQTRG